MYILNELLARYGTSKPVTDLLNKIGVVVIPVVNPDGYDYSWTNDRLWRKNRRRNSDGTYGVDLNRNWDSHWGGQGSSKVPKDETYCGTGPFSEPESKSVAGFLSSLDKIIAAVDIHSYSQLILRPWGWTRTPPSNNAALTTLGAKMKEIIRSVHGKDYTNQAAWELYFTTGSAQDWFGEKANINVSFTIELRDTGRYGFVLPPAEIIPTGQELYEALFYLMNFVAFPTWERK